MSEHDQQKAVVEYCDRILIHKQREKVNGHFPIFATPSAGKRSHQLAAYMKAEGLRAGVPDLFIPVARGGFHGLWIEMKTVVGKISPSQIEWIQYLTDAGYMAKVCRSASEAIDCIEKYLHEKLTPTHDNGTSNNARKQ